MLEDEERQLAGVDSPFYTTTTTFIFILLQGRDFRSVEPGYTKLSQAFVLIIAGRSRGYVKPNDEL